MSNKTPMEILEDMENGTTEEETDVAVEAPVNAEEDPGEVERFIPANQLKSAVHALRDSRRRQRERAEKAERELAELRQQAEAKQAEVSAETGEDPLVFTDDELDELEIVRPGIKESVAKAKKALSAMADRNAEAKRRADQIEMERTTELQQKVMEKAREIPELCYWEAEEPDVWATVLEIDQRLVNSGAYDDLVDRFNEVVRLTRKKHGDLAKLPEITDVNKDEPWALLIDEDEPPPKADVRDIKGKGARAPRTLDDIGGGYAKADVNVDKLSPAELADLVDTADGYDGMVAVMRRARKR
jgi:hypothetical protein